MNTFRGIIFILAAVWSSRFTRAAHTGTLAGAKAAEATPFPTCENVTQKCAIGCREGNLITSDSWLSLAIHVLPHNFYAAAKIFKRDLFRRQ